MSMERCGDCGCQIDTDFDDGCYVELGNMRAQTYDAILCEACRERRLQEIYTGDEPDVEQFYADRELERAKEVIRQSAARGLSKDIRERNDFMMAMNDTNPGADCEPR